MIFYWISIIFVVLVPLYLWAYGASRLESRDSLLQGRFWAGIFSGGLSVALTWLLAHSTQKLSFLPLFAGILFGCILLYGVVYFYARYGSHSSAKVLQKIACIHLAGIFFFLILLLSLSYLLTDSVIFGAFLLPLFIAAFFEEASKHLSTLGLLGQSQHPSRREIVLFAFYVVLGFAFIENILYLQSYGLSLFTWLFRSTFTFSAHLLSATVCTFFWWRALAFPLISRQYFLYFFGGFFLASLIHMLYNYFANIGNIWILCVYLVASYITFTQLLIAKEKSDK